MQADAFTVVVAIALMLSAGLGLGFLARFAKLPSVLGELIAGLLLGPTVLGRIAPHLELLLFAPDNDHAFFRMGFINVCLIVFLFMAGTEVRLGSFRSLRRAIFWTSGLGLLVPFLVGLGATLARPDFFSHTEFLPPWGLACLVGAAFSISALPVIARVLMDLDLLHTHVGTVVLCAATLDDVVGFGVFAFLSHAYAPAGSASYLSLGILAAFALGVWLRDARPSADDALVKRLQWLATHLFAPIYFVSIGLATDFAVNFDWPLVLTVFVLASVAKYAGVRVGARIAGMQVHEARAIGFGMTARGSMAMMFAATARANGLIENRLFVAVVVMALVTSLFAGPAMSRALQQQPT